MTLSILQWWDSVKDIVAQDNEAALPIPCVAPPCPPETEHTVRVIS